MIINENLALDSGSVVKSNAYMAKEYKLSEDWITGQKYTLSFKLNSFKGEKIVIYKEGGSTSIFDVIPSNFKSGNNTFTFTCPEVAGSSHAQSKPKNLLNFYVLPFTLSEQYPERYLEISEVKLEKGTEATMWIPNKLDLTPTQQSNYLDFSGGVSNSRRFSHCKDCEVVLC